MEPYNIFALVLGVAFVAFMVWKFIGMHKPIPPATNTPKPTGGSGTTGGSGNSTGSTVGGAKSKTVRNKK